MSVDEVLAKGSAAAAQSRAWRARFLDAVRSGQVDLALAVQSVGGGRDPDDVVHPQLLAAERALGRIRVIDFLRALPRFQDHPRQADALLLRAGIRPEKTLAYLAQRHPRGARAVEALSAQLAPRTRDRQLAPTWPYFVEEAA